MTNKVITVSEFFLPTSDSLGMGRAPENGTRWVRTKHIWSDKRKLNSRQIRQTHSRLDKLSRKWDKLEDRTKHSTISNKLSFFLCLKSNCDVYGLLSQLEPISKIRTPSDYCWLEEFRVRTTFCFWSPGHGSILRSVN